MVGASGSTHRASRRLGGLFKAIKKTAGGGDVIMDWDKLRIFQAVADAGSFTHAGDGLKLSQSAISRQIGALEEQLGVMLFHRHARGLILPEQADLLSLTARAMAGKGKTPASLLRAHRCKPA